MTGSVTHATKHHCHGMQEWRWSLAATPRNMWEVTYVEGRHRPLDRHSNVYVIRPHCASHPVDHFRGGLEWTCMQGLDRGCAVLELIAASHAALLPTSC